MNPIYPWSLKTKRQLIIDDVISAIYAGSVEGGPNGLLKAQVKRVSVELGRRKAHQFTKRLLDSLAVSADEVVQLEALVVLGFAHPEVFRKNHISLTTEGRRLGTLLEKAGRADRGREVMELLCERYPDDRTLELELAGIVRRAGNSEELIERYMERAQEHLQRKEMAEALPWLQQILALDRSRSDVTSMISDVRHHQANKVNSARSNRRFFVVFLLIAGIVGGLAYREYHIHEQMKAMETVDRSDTGSMAARIANLEAFRDQHRIWLGRNRVDREITELQGESQRIREEAVEQVEREQQAMAESITEAEYLRELGLKAADRSDWKDARLNFQKALNTAPQGWTHRASLEKDIAAIDSLGSEQ